MSVNNNKFPENDYLFPAVMESSRLLVGCKTEDYSASRIARAVEDCDAHLLNLNVTNIGGNMAGDEVDAEYGVSESTFPVVFDLRINHSNTARVSRSLERYGYTVIDVQDSAVSDDDTARQRVEHLLKYLEI